MILNKIRFFTILLMALGLFPDSSYAAVTAEEVVQKAAAVINNSKSINADFTLSTNGHSTKGVIKSRGNKFTMRLPEVSTWYNGKDLYTYNPRTVETTITVPTAQELLESNPLLYVKGGAGGYSYSFSPQKQSGKYIVNLVPRNKKSNIKKLTFIVNAKTFQAEKIVVEMNGGETIINVTSFKTGEVISDSEFEYPKAKFPKAEIVDLR